jgi:hypothetical protein
MATIVNLEQQDALQKFKKKLRECCTIERKGKGN